MSAQYSADDMSISVVRTIANYTASKLSSLSETEISLLSDDALGELIGAELSRLPKDELNRFVEDQLSLFVLPILEAVFSNLSSPLKAAANDKSQDITTHKYHEGVSFVDAMFVFGCEFISLSIPLGLVFMTSFKYIRPIIHKFCQERKEKQKLKPLERSIFLSKYSTTSEFKGLKGIAETYVQQTDTGFRQWSAKILSRDVIVTTIDTQKKEKLKLKPLERSIFLSKYSTTSEFKGLKGIAATYTQQTDTGIRQFMIQESFVNGESFSLPAIRPCNKKQIRGKEVCYEVDSGMIH